MNVVPNQKRKTLQAEIKKHVKAGITVYTDALKSYEGLDSMYVHKMIDHAVEYVNGEVHTNGMENFWSLLKRMLGGTYVSVAPKHLTRYCAEEAYRFNERTGSDAARFSKVMQSVPGNAIDVQATDWQNGIGNGLLKNEAGRMVLATIRPVMLQVCCCRHEPRCTSDCLSACPSDWDKRKTLAESGY